MEAHVRTMVKDGNRGTQVRIGQKVTWTPRDVVDVVYDLMREGYVVGV